jgi:hypothetical protein
MMVWIPGKVLAGSLGRKSWQEVSWQEVAGGGLRRRAWQQGLAINKQALGWIVAGFKGGFVFIPDDAKPDASCSLRIQGIVSNLLSYYCLRHIRMA